MKRFANLRLFVCLEEGSRTGIKTHQLSEVYEEFVSTILHEFIQESDLNQLYQSLVFCQYKLQVFESNFSTGENPDVDMLPVLKNAKSLLKNHLSFVKGLIIGEQSMRTIERFPNEVRTNKSIKWTKSKTDLVELAYAAIANETFNNGKIEVKELITYLSEMFEVPLDNYYDTYIQIRRRKGSRTAFLDEMIKDLQLKMDDTDNKFVHRNR